MELEILSVKDILEYRLCRQRCRMIEAKLQPYDPEIAEALSGTVGTTERFIKSLQKLDDEGEG